MQDETIKSKIRERYRAVAIGMQAENQCCCGSKNPLADTSCISDTMAEQYSAADKAAMPEGADLGLGCGVPTRYSNIQKGETVLDLGSGAGVDVFLAARDTGENGFVYGVDMLPEMVSKARANAEQLGAKNVEFRLGELEHLPFDSASIDVVISNCVLNLVPNKPLAFAEIARVLKPGGRMVVSDMMLHGDLPDEIRKDIEAWAGCIAGAPKVEEYLAFVTNAGMQNVKIVKETPYDWGKGDHFQVVSCIVEAYK